MVLVVDGAEFALASSYGDHAAEFARIEQAIFRCEVELVHLADGAAVLINWRSIRVVELRAA